MDKGTQVWIEGVKLDRYVDRLGIIRDGRGNTIKPLLLGNVAYVTQDTDGKVYSAPLSYVVADAYLTRPEGSFKVEIVDRDPLNCCIDNLQWLTQEMIVDRYQLQYKLTSDIVNDDHWKTAKTPAGKLDVSPTGKIRNHDTGEVIVPKALKQRPVIYYTEHINGRNRYRWLSVDKLVADTWIPNPDQRYFVLHLNGDPWDCHVYNLAWDDGLVVHPPIVSKTLSQDMVHLLCQLMESGTTSDADISAITHVSRKVLTDIRNGKIHTDVASQYNLQSKQRSAELQAQVVKLIEDGCKPAEIMEKLNMEYNTANISYVNRVRTKYLQGKI